MTLIIVLATVLDVGFIGGIVYLIFGKLLHSNALGKLFGIVAGIACGALMLWILGGDNDISLWNYICACRNITVTAAHSPEEQGREMTR